MFEMKTHMIRLVFWMVPGTYIRRQMVGDISVLMYCFTQPLPSFLLSAFTALGVTALPGGGMKLNISRTSSHFSGSSIASVSSENLKNL